MLLLLQNRDKILQWLINRMEAAIFVKTGTYFLFQNEERSERIIPV